MKASLAPSSVGKFLTTLAITAGMTMYGCSRETERSEAAKQQFKSVGDTETKLLKGRGKGVQKGFGPPRSIKGKLADIDKEKEAEQ
jgi:hypothetical protein